MTPVRRWSGRLPCQLSYRRTQNRAPPLTHLTLPSFRLPIHEVDHTKREAFDAFGSDDRVGAELIWGPGVGPVDDALYGAVDCVEKFEPEAVPTVVVVRELGEQLVVSLGTLFRRERHRGRV